MDTLGPKRIVALLGVIAGMTLGAAAGFAQHDVPGAGFAAIPGTKGGQDMFGPYEVVRNWPKPLAKPTYDQAEEGGRPGVDWRWEHYVIVVNREGEVIENWTLGKPWKGVW
jgi:hypothetical protein